MGGLKIELEILGLITKILIKNKNELDKLLLFFAVRQLEIAIELDNSLEIIGQNLAADRVGFLERIRAAQIFIVCQPASLLYPRGGAPFS